MKIITLFNLFLAHILAIFTSHVQAKCQTQTDVKITFYGWPDNGGNADVRSPCGRRRVAGGTGTYEDPLTFAAADGIYKDCEIIYIPYLQKFARHEDSCGACSDDKQEGHGIRIDIWIGSNTADGGSLVKSCESTLTPSQKQTIIRNVGSGFPVDPRALFQVSRRDPTKGTCQSTYTYPAFRPGCPTTNSELPGLSGEYAQYPAANIGGGDDSSKPVGPDIDTDSNNAGQGFISLLDSVTGQSVTASSDQSANQILTEGDTKAPFANLNVNLGNGPTVATGEGRDSWGFFNSDVIPGTTQYTKQNTNQATTEFNKDQTAQSPNQIIPSNGNTYVADGGQVLSQFSKPDTFPSNLNPVDNQETNSATTAPTTNSQDTTPLNFNLIPNLASLGPSSTFGDMHLADKNLLGTFGNVDNIISSGGNGVFNGEANDKNYNYDSILPT